MRQLISNIGALRRLHYRAKGALGVGGQSDDGEIVGDLSDRTAPGYSLAAVQTVINYPVLLPFLPAYARLDVRPEDSRNAHHNRSRVLSLPIYPEMTRDKQDWVIESVRRFD
jgi:hypothetical protein